MYMGCELKTGIAFITADAFVRSLPSACYLMYFTCSVYTTQHTLIIIMGRIMNRDLDCCSSARYKVDEKSLCTET